MPVASRRNLGYIKWIFPLHRSKLEKEKEAEAITATNSNRRW
jgi:hypothetical protein